ncbi:terminase family protein [Geminicoccus harenae]|uniref:terminase family protein n=1 Tax=Geminicoccus harenae TaxID=2498453 RepID=UPI00168C0684|nr:terminase family protein [Geminicoccus harenae]
MAAQHERGLVRVWRPHPGPQEWLLSCPAFEVLFGGARGGGKTDGMLGDWACHASRYGQHAIGKFFRRELEQLKETMHRAKALYGPIGAVWHESDKMFTFPDGARLGFAYLDNDADAEKYQGHSYTRVYVEELQNFPDPLPIAKLRATLRSGAGVPCRFRATANPGGPGHQHVKVRYIDPAPGGMVPIYERDEETGITLDRIYIPSKVKDNPSLDARYIVQLKMLGSAELVRAWLDGDWDVIQGAFFDNWRSDRHMIKPFAIPKHWPRIRAFDWGSAKPFAVIWAALSDGSIPAIPRGCLVVYREWYGCPDGQANVGIKLKNELIAQGIVAREEGEEMADAVADPAIFAEEGGPSIAEVMHREGCRFRRADNKRPPGWQQIRSRLEGDGDGRPMLMVFDTCRHLIRTLPALQHDQHRPEDVDTDGEDHAADALRYLCMTRPYHRPQPVEKPREIDTRIPTFNQLLEMHEAQRGSRI